MTTTTYAWIYLSCNIISFKCPKVMHTRIIGPSGFQVGFQVRYRLETESTIYRWFPSWINECRLSRKLQAKLVKKSYQVDCLTTQNKIMTVKLETFQKFQIQNKEKKMFRHFKNEQKLAKKHLKVKSC